MSLGIYAWKYLTDQRCFSTYIQVADSVVTVRQRIAEKIYKNDRMIKITCELAVCPIPSNQHTKIYFMRSDGIEVCYKNITDLVLNEEPNIKGEHLFSGILVTAHDTY